MLKRDISTINILILSASGMIGSGWLFSPFISAQIAGNNALISWLIAAIFMLFIALPLCELGTIFPVSGGLSNYPTYTHGTAVGFLFAWTSWLSYVVMTPIEIQAILQYSSHFFPSLLAPHTSTFALSGYGYLAAILIMLCVVTLNSYGVKLLTECNKYVGLLKFILPSIAIIAFSSQANDVTTLDLHLNQLSDWKDIFSALSIGGIAFAFTGFQNGLMLAGEVKKPQRNIPISILGAVLIGFLLYACLQWSFLIAMPKQYVTQGWHALHYPSDNGPLVGLALLLGLGFIAMLLMIDAIFSPFGTTFVYTAATSRILYGMALNQHLPKLFLTVNRHRIPYMTLYANFAVGLLAFLPFPGWQKMVAFLSSASILSYTIGPICLLAMRKLQPEISRPFRLRYHRFFAYTSFYFCNLMLYWCGFDVLWKLALTLLLGLAINLVYQRKNNLDGSLALPWFIFYILSLLSISYLGSWRDRFTRVPRRLALFFAVQHLMLSIIIQGYPI